MSKNHSFICQPKDKNLSVWRYMDITKLISILSSGSIFFSRADSFEDTYEGRWPAKNYHTHGFFDLSKTQEEQNKFLEKQNKIYGSSSNLSKFVAVSCWHMNEHESAAMWKLYLQGSDGIAIKTSYSSLEQSFSNKNILLGEVDYINQDKTLPLDYLAPFFHKRKSFEHEKELRALISKIPENEEFTDGEIQNGGIKVQVDLKKLISTIHISPTSQQWFADVVKSVIHKYGYSFDIVQSRLYEEPNSDKPPIY